MHPGIFELLRTYAYMVNLGLGEFSFYGPILGPSGCKN
jgi:hypothetical protein